MPRNENRRTNSDRSGASQSNSDRRGSQKTEKETSSLNGFESEIDGQIEPQSDEKEE